MIGVFVAPRRRGSRQYTSTEGNPRVVRETILPVLQNRSEN